MQLLTPCLEIHPLDLAITETSIAEVNSTTSDAIGEKENTNNVNDQQVETSSEKDQEGWKLQKNDPIFSKKLH